ncbi:MAG: hypothetical protein JWL62_3852 [Hyphomicrobiales bacterium]|nr:hypothetical protein [Hyphomicrobiales bacterium]
MGNLRGVYAELGRTPLAHDPRPSATDTAEVLVTTYGQFRASTLIWQTRRTQMKRTALLILTTIMITLGGGPTIAQALNNEVVCSQPGYKHDPRC